MVETVSQNTKQSKSEIIGKGLDSRNTASWKSDYLFKVIIIGDSAVGKSCLLNRLTKDEFLDEYTITIGVEFGNFLVKINNDLVKLQIWDTAGQESFKSITKIFYKGSHAICVVFDITQYDTYLSTREWLKEAKQNLDDEAFFFLIGNRSDLDEKRQVPQTEGMKQVLKSDFDQYFETSAKTGKNVEEVFSQIAEKLYENQKAREAEGISSPGRTSYQRTSIRLTKERQTSQPYREEQEPGYCCQ